MLNIKAYEAMAKLNLEESERNEISEQAERLTDSFTLLENINTDGVQPLVSVLDIQNVLREDAAVKMVPRETLLAEAPESCDGYFQVPKTLE